MPLKNNNIASGLPEKSQYQVGVSNVDSATPTIEKGVLLPWPSDPSTSWVYFQCTMGVMLDSGIVVHNRLPQVDNAPDTLSVMDLNNSDAPIKVGGVNLSCKDQYQDIVQRMGHSRYWFRLWGRALRIGYQVPIPGVRTIGGVPAIPYDKNPQWAFNRVFPGGNYGGAVLWHAEWSLWYTTAAPPRDSNDVPAVDLAAHISGKTPLPDTNGIQTPYSRPDDNAVASHPPTNVNTDPPFGRPGGRL